MLTLSVDDRRRVALVYIDTDDPSAALTEFRHQHNGVFQEFPLRIAVPAGISYGGRERQELSDPAAPSTDEDLELHTFVKGKEPQYFANGAGGIRNNGHVAACFHHQAIYDTLDSALVTVTRIDDTLNGKRVNEIQINIVAFLGGGTGSGILPDIAVMARDLLANYQYRQRINLFCMLPEPVREASQTDLSWRKSNATACLLELLAYSAAAGSRRSGRYNKYMRERVYCLTNDPIANEIYLIGHSSLGDAVGTARIVGLDLFQRTTDASGVGFLEHSKWVDRRTLGETDDRGLPTMFGTSCPLEISFPAYETANAFARISAAHLLPLLASFKPQNTSASEVDKRNWLREWDNVARIDANPGDPRVIRPAVFNLDDFVEADQHTLDNLWAKLQRFEEETERKVAAVLDIKRSEELQQINGTSALVTGNTNKSLLNVRIQHLQLLEEEYSYMLDTLDSTGIPPVPQRPVDLEGDLTRRGTWWFRIRNMGRDSAYDVYNAYNERLEAHARATRHRLLEELLRNLLQNTKEALSSAMSWLEEAQVQQHQQELEISGMTSMAWQGRLDDSHPHQRHIFDLRTLRSGDGRNIAVERLYHWATGGDKVLTQGTPIDYSSYINRCVDYLTRTISDPRVARQQGDGHIESYSAGRLAHRVVDFFHDYYMKTFQDMNIFELLDKGTPPSPKGQPRARQLSDFLLEHLQYVSKLIGSLIAFEAELWSKGSTTLDTSIYLGIHWRDGYQRGVLDTAMGNLGPLTTRGQSARVEASLDPHRLQLVYGQHAISLSTVRDFYLRQNSSMAFYLYHQEKWENVGSDVYGYMPVHSCSEAQWLVCNRKAMGYQPPTALYERVIRKPS
jgi:hypothetical protein